MNRTSVALLCRQAHDHSGTSPYWWGQRGSNSRPSHSECGALPSELYPYEMVCAAGFDPAVSCFQGRRITRLSHAQMIDRNRNRCDDPVHRVHRLFGEQPTQEAHHEKLIQHLITLTEFLEYLTGPLHLPGVGDFLMWWSTEDSNLAPPVS